MARIVEVAVAPLLRPLHTPFVTALRTTTRVESLIVRLTGEDGGCGYGEAPQVWRVTGESIAGASACVLGPLADALLGVELNPTSVGTLHLRLEESVAGNGGARAACEVAAIDIVARSANLSTSQLLGSEATSVRTDLTVSATSSDPMQASHFQHLKVKVGLEPDDVNRLIRIHRAATSPVRFRIDANQMWDSASALASVATWYDAGLDIEFIEQPLPRWDIDGHAALRESLPVPLMLDESVFDRHDLARIIDAGATDLINIKLAKCGGAFAGLELARLAHEANLDVMVGSMLESEIGVAAAAALAAAVAPDTVHDLDAAWWSTPEDASGPYIRDRFVLPGVEGIHPGFGLADLQWTSRSLSGPDPRQGGSPERGTDSDLREASS